MVDCPSARNRPRPAVSPSPAIRTEWNLIRPSQVGKNKKTLPSNFLKVNHNLSYIVEFMGIVVVARVEFHLNLLNKVRERTLLEGGRGIEAAPLFTRLEKWSTTNWFLMKGGERIV